MKKKVIATLLTVAMTASMLAGCGSEKGSTQDSGNAQNQPAEEESSAASADDADEAGEVTIKLFSNLPDRKNGQGLVEQTIIDEYMAANANVTIEVEALDEEAYKTKFKAYAMDGMPDAETACFLTDILVQVAGINYADIVSNAVATGDFSAPEIKQATQILVNSADAGMFQIGYDSQDYGTTMNLFTNGQAAMYCMGSWDCSMALNEDIAPEIRENIRAFTMPVVEGGKGGANDIAAWNGGGYAVSADSKVRDEAVKFLNYMYQPDKLSKYGWENGVGLSAQDQTPYLTGSETELQKQVMEILRNASSISGVPSCVKQGRWHSDGALRGGASGTVSAHSENEVWQAADV